MPHSSGGGSHGGGSHGGSHGGSSGPRISRTYFPGARYYRRHYHSGIRQDEYVYASSRPQKASLASVIIVIVMAAVFTTFMVIGVGTTIPRRLRTKYIDAPVIHDDIDVIDNEKELLKILKEYNELTGICPDIYTVYDEMWKDDHPSLESYTYKKYVDEFKDEQHFVIVYSIPIAQALEIYDGSTEVPDYSWEAVQGDETDAIITESMFKRFADIMQDDLESGSGAGAALEDAFEYALKSAEKQLNPVSPSRFAGILASFSPLLIVSGFFVPMIILSVRSYIKDKDVEYEEVPLDHQPAVITADGKTIEQGPDGSARITEINGTKHVVIEKGNGYYSKDVHYDIADSSAPKALKLLPIFIMIPFLVVGLIILGVGIGLQMSGNKENFGIALIIFGVIWLVVCILSFAKMIAQYVKDKKGNRS